RTVDLPWIRFGSVSRLLERGRERALEFYCLGLGIRSACVIGCDGARADLDLSRRASGRGHTLVIHSRLRETALGDVARRKKLRRSDRIELERALARIGDHGDRRILLSALESGVHIVGERLV